MASEESGVSATCTRTQQIRERNKRRRRSIKIKRREIVRNAISISKELEHKKIELALTRSKLEQTRKRALELSKELCKPPVMKSCSSSSVLFRAHLRTKPTASSGYCSSHKFLYHSNSEILDYPVNKLDRYSLKKTDGATCELGSGTFGKCTKMLLCATEVAVKVTTLKEYLYDSIMYEAKVMTHVCRGHPNLPLFIGIYDHQEYAKPLLVMKYYSLAGKSCTLHQYIHNQYQCPSNKPLKDWVLILLGICNGLEAIHQKGFLHNDLKCDNIVLSDCVPASNVAHLPWPIIIDFGKAKPVQFPKKYNLTKKEKEDYLQKFSHLAPELVSGLCAQSPSTDTYSLGHIIRKVSILVKSDELKSIAKLCKAVYTSRPSISYVHESLSHMKI